MQKEKRKLPWLKGSAFNFAWLETPREIYRCERSNTPEGWKFLVSTKKLTYMHVDSVPYLKEELDEAIYQWIEEYETTRYR